MNKKNFNFAMNVALLKCNKIKLIFYFIKNDFFCICSEFFLSFRCDYLCTTSDLSRGVWPGYDLDLVNLSRIEDLESKTFDCQEFDIARCLRWEDALKYADCFSG